MGHRGRDHGRVGQGKFRTNCKNNISADRIKRPLQTKRFTNNPLNPVSSDSPFELSVDTDSDAVIAQFVGDKNQGKPLTTKSFSLPVDLIKLPSLAKQGCFREFILRQSYQAERRLRPLARRAFKIARPARVDIRLRNPWVRLRFILLG